ncbi:MAG: DUF4338 domain-containing protein [Chitinispirillia bacterium]|jgi:hypothetical protein
MTIGIRYKGITVTSEEIDFIKALIRNNPHDSRRILSKKLCQEWNWKQANGSLRDMYCRSFMLQLHRDGYITLPVRKKTPNNPLAYRKSPPAITIDRTSVKKKVSQIHPLDFQQVRGSSLEKVYNGLISQYHYLGYCHPIGEHLKYVVYWHDRPVSCLAFCSSPRHIGARDRYIGWNKEVREKNLHLIVYNTRFLLLPWIHVRYLASHILSRIVKRLSFDWQDYYNHPVYFVETFVDTEKFLGTCYKAANWRYLGKTTGRGKNDQTHKANRSIKAVWGYPLTQEFRHLLTKAG